MLLSWISYHSSELDASTRPISYHGWAWCSFRIYINISIQYHIILYGMCAVTRRHLSSMPFILLSITYHVYHIMSESKICSWCYCHITPPVKKLRLMEDELIHLIWQYYILIYNMCVWLSLMSWLWFTLVCVWTVFNIGNGNIIQRSYSCCWPYIRSLWLGRGPTLRHE